MLNEYCFKVMLGREYISHVGNIRAKNESEALIEAMDYVESSWQGIRVHPTELNSLTYIISSIK